MATTTPRTWCPAPSAVKAGCSSTSLCIRRCRAGWATNCTRSPCRRARPRTETFDEAAAVAAAYRRGLTMDSTVQDRIRDQINEAPVVLYMKGTPVFPQCGFSAAVVQILSHLGVKFKGIDVLSDPSVREGIKEFSNWPTIPQLYIQGEFVGGCDIVREMFETGELKQLFEEKGVPVRAA